MAGKDDGLPWECQDPGPDRFFQGPGGAAGEVGPADASVKEGVAGEKEPVALETHAAGSMSRGVDNAKARLPDHNGFPVLEQTVGRRRLLGPEKEA
jgi:hypothetical protein